MLALLFFFMAETYDISEVGGKHLMSAFTAHGNSYLYYRQGMTKFDTFVYNWNQGKCTLAPVDSRVRLMGFSFLVPTSDGVAVISCGTIQAFTLNKKGEFLDGIDLKVYLDPGEVSTFAAPGTGDTFLLSSKLGGHVFYSRFDLASMTREILYRVPDPGSYYLLPNGTGEHLLIQYGTGEVVTLDKSFQQKGRQGGMFEAPKKPTALGFFKKSSTQSLRNPILAADGLVTMSYIASDGGDRLEASGRFDGQLFHFSGYRQICFSPDGEQQLVYVYQDDEIRIVPADFKFPEVRFPPLPGDKWPPE